MTSPLFRRSVTPLNASMIAYLRSWVDLPYRVPAPPYVGASPLSPEQTRLLLSATYGAGLTVAELARTRVDAFLDDEGRPRERVRVVPGTTRTRTSRTVLMHPDVRRDVLAFREKHRDEEFVAFIPHAEGRPRFKHMQPHGLGVWFSQLYREAGLNGLTGYSGRLFFNASERTRNMAKQQGPNDAAAAFDQIRSSESREELIAALREAVGGFDIEAFASSPLELGASEAADA